MVTTYLNSFASHAGPFCQRVLLSVEEKSIPYTKGYVDFAAKPEW